MIRFFIRNSMLVNVITFAVIGAGLFILPGIPRALLPGADINGVAYTFRVPSASAVEIEQLVTFRVEAALTGLPDVEKVESNTQDGSTTITVLYEPGLSYKDHQILREQIDARVSSVQNLLPPDMLPIERRETRPGFGGAGTNYVFMGSDPNNPAHREIAELVVQRLERIPEVLKAETNLPTFRLVIKPHDDAVARAGLDAGQIRTTVLQMLRDYGIGVLDIKDEHLTLTQRGKADDIEAIKNAVLSQNRAGRGVRIRDVADVDYEREYEGYRTLIEGEEHITFEASWDLQNTDAVDAAQAVEDELKKIQAEGRIPADWEPRLVFNTADLIEHQFSTLIDNGIFGVLIVLLLLTLALSFRTSLIAALGLPFCFSGIVIVLWLAGIALNFVTLAAMILIAGLLVDDAIIMCEAFAQERENGLSAEDAALAAVHKMWRPVVGMGATTVLAFATLLVSPSHESAIIKPLPVVAIAGLAFSVFECFFLLPNHLAHWGDATVKREGPFWLKLRAVYEWALRIGMRLRYLVVVGGIGAIVLAISLVSNGTVPFSTSLSLNPQVDVEFSFAQKASTLDELEAWSRPVTEKVRAMGGDLVASVHTKVGRKWRVGFSNLDWSSGRVTLYPPGGFVEQEKLRHVLMDRLKPQLEAAQAELGLASLRIGVRQEDREQEVVEVFVSGGDRLSFTDVQNEIRGALTGRKGIVDVYMDPGRMQRSYVFVPDLHRLRQHGIGPTDVLRQIRVHFSTDLGDRFRFQGKDIPVVFKAGDDAPTDVKALSNLQITNQRGLGVPLSFLGRWEEMTVLRDIEHRDGLRVFRIDVSFDKEQTKLEEVKESIEESLAPVREKYPGYHLSVRPSERLEKTKAWYQGLAMIALLLIYVTLVLALNSLSKPVVVVAAIPFGLAGAIYAFLVHGDTLTVLAVVGALGLTGIVVNDSLVMTVALDERLRAARNVAERRAAVVAGASSRLRAVLLTTATTLAGVFPLAYGLFGDAGWMAPMVLAVGWGLVFATALTLMFIPAFVGVLEDGRTISARVAGAVVRVVVGLLRRVRPGGSTPAGEEGPTATAPSPAGPSPGTTETAPDTETAPEAGAEPAASDDVDAGSDAKKPA